MVNKVDNNSMEELFDNDLSEQISGDFIALMDDYFSLPGFFDNELDKQIARWYSNPPNVFPQYPYFSPSSLGSCPRELYIKAKYGNKVRDQDRDKPWRGRWRSLGTISGDLIQRELLSIQRNYHKQTGNHERFRFEFNDDGTPMFEEFAKKSKAVTHDGEDFFLYGAPDGIMQYATDTGEIIRVGLEVKSKQGTPARTSLYSMKEPDQSHSDQVVAYAEMYDVDYYMIVYINLAKQSWNMTDEQYEKTPDIRAFCKKIDGTDKAKVFDKAAKVTKAVREGIPPKMDLNEYTFNNFKQATSESLSTEEVEEIERYAEAMKKSSLPQWRISSLVSAVEDVKKRREKAGL